MAVDLYQDIASPLYQGSDVKFLSSGEFYTVDGSEKTRQRLMRRYLTNPGDYLWQPTYGAGIPAYIGKGFNQSIKQKLESLLVSQTLQESGVARVPNPSATVTQPQLNTLVISVSYTDAITNTTQILSFQVGKNGN